MNRAAVVIGASYGDEGKGAVVDALAALQPDTTVIRAHSGAQAGHTVTRPDGMRHVFSHIGAGSFAGASTYLSRYMVTHPLLFKKEYQQLLSLGVSPAVAVSPLALVTTPFDMAINQDLESHRGRGRHGSCGIGFGEAIERSLHPEFTLTVHDLLTPGTIVSTFRRIHRQWLPERLRALGLSMDEMPLTRQLADSDRLISAFLADCAYFLEHIILASAPEADRQLVFENAQGLLLDQDRGFFPHVTRSNTGLHNVLLLAQEWGISELDLYYVTRPYLTRHGAGPFPGELPTPPFSAIVDLTNHPNPFQETLRYGVLDLDALRTRLHDDLGDAATAGLRVHPFLAVTCLDQIVHDRVPYLSNDQKCVGTVADFLAQLQRVTGLVVAYTKAGHSRDEGRWCRPCNDRARAA